MYQKKQGGEPYNIIYTATSDDDFSIGYKGHHPHRRPVLLNRQGQTAYMGNQTKILNRSQGKLWYVQDKRWDNRDVLEVSSDAFDNLVNPERIRWDSM